MPEALTRLGVHLPSLIIFSLNFLILWGILYLVAFRPFFRRLKERLQEEERRREETAEIHQLRQEAAQAREEALAEGRKERDALIRAAEAEAEHLVRDGINRARKAGQNQLRRTREQLRQEHSRAYRELHDSFIELVLVAAEGALGRAIEQEEREKLLREAAQELAEIGTKSFSDSRVGFVAVTTAFPLNEVQKEQISGFLARITRKDARILYRVDESVLGGMSITTGDAFLDATIGGRLDRLRHHLLSGSQPDG
ncbi:MAG: hypothetical protein GTO40_05980 [Deltaproteobacteria bacterium]|nr:hypothetical protein [Deltaproteobacteria bacterium]